MSLLVSNRCGVSNFSECNELQGKLAKAFGGKITTTENHTGRDSLDLLINEIKEKNISHYLTSEGLIPLSFKKIKEVCPDLTILKLGQLSREVLPSGDKVSNFTSDSKIFELVEFRSDTHQLDGCINDQEIDICRLTRHDLNPQQEAAMKTHFPNGSFRKIDTNFDNVDAILAHPEIQNAQVLEVVLPPHMVMELLEKKPDSMQVIRAQMYQGREFQYYEEIEKTVTTLKEFG